MHPGDIDQGPVPAVDEYLCPVAGCDFAVGATGPVDPDEPDDFRDEVEEHRRRHLADPDDPTSMALPVIGDTVLLSDGTTGRVTGRLHATWRVETDARTRYVYLHQIIGYPDAPVDSAQHRSSSQAGLASLSTSGGAVTSTPAPSEAPAPDHGPLAATLSDTTLAKVLSRPAHVPSLVLLDRLESADRLAVAADAMLDAAARGITTGPVVERLYAALDNYRQAVGS